MDKGKKETLKWIAIFGVIALGVGGYFIYENNKNGTAVSKSNMVNYILDNSGGTGNYQGLMGLDSGYIGAWYNALMADKTTFTAGTGTFSTTTGTAV